MKFWSKIFLLLLSFTIVFPWFHSGYPAFADSLEPIVISQAIFIRNNWPNVAWNNSWYLGYPFRFTGSPLLPYFLAILNFLIPSSSVWIVHHYILGIAFILMTFGIYKVAKRFLTDDNHSKGDISPLTAALLFLTLPSVLFFFPQVFQIGNKIGFFPWQYLFLAKLGNGQRFLGLSLLPYCLLILDGNLKTNNSRLFWPIIATVFLSLVDLSSLVTLIILVILRLISFAIVGKLGKKIKKALAIFAYSLLILGFYYSPRFWWQWLTAPSLAGARTLNVGLFLIRIVSLVVSLGLGVLMAIGKKKKKSRIIFLILWPFVFFLLTIARFIADSDFWQDYTGWGVELGMGIALLTAVFISKIRVQKSKIFSIVIFSFLLMLAWIKNRGLLLTPSQNISSQVEYQIAQILEERMSSTERVYLSGSTAFWLDSFSDLWQVRGGQDKAATHPFWADASYQIREGENPKLSYLWLNALGTSWLVVHDKNSKEPYHDFKYPLKFQNSGDFQAVWQRGGDYLYNLKVSIAREINDEEKFTHLRLPKDGTDQEALEGYNLLLGKEIDLQSDDNDQIVIRAMNDGPISLAITFDPEWTAIQGSQKIELRKDCLGQIIVFPKQKGEITLKYNQLSKERILGLGLSILGIYLTLRKVNSKNS